MQYTEKSYGAFDVFVRASLYMRREENQLEATERFIARIICSTRFGHFYAHHQELENILVLLPHTVCNAFVAGGWWSGAGLQAMRPGCRFGVVTKDTGENYDV
jgi:hypothetical protein